MINIVNMTGKKNITTLKSLNEIKQMTLKDPKVNP